MNLIEQTTILIEKEFPKLGVNKKREIVRLVWEISKRDSLSPQAVLQPYLGSEFVALKKQLLKTRFTVTKGKASYYLPKLEAGVCPANTQRTLYYPKNIFIDKQSVNSAVALRVKEKFPDSNFYYVESVKEAAGHKIIKQSSYNNRLDNLLVVYENYDFFKPCPCTKNALSCGYNLINLGFGCPFECSYCYLQNYQNLPAVVLQSNINSYLERLDLSNCAKGVFPYKRIGSGEYSDSLALDDISGYSLDIINYFKNKDCVFEFKTKSCNVDNLFKVKAPSNIVAAWSLNPTEVGENELLSEPVAKRIECAAKCAAYGYKTAFHFDPVFYYEGWHKDYEKLIQNLFAQLPSESVEWISIGTLRFAPPLKKEIEKRFPNNKILDAEFILDFDGKMRYPRQVRINIYKTIIAVLKRYCAPKTVVYLCMESPAIWKEAGLLG